MPRITAIDILDTRPQLSSVFQFGNVQRHGSTNIYVRVTTDEGTQGWGEACPVPQLTDWTAEQLVAELAQTSREHLLGKAVGEIPRLLDLITEMTHSVFVRAALDTALLDLRARALGVQLAELLGGPRRPALEVHGSIGWDERPEKMAETAMQQSREYRVLKTYLGRADLESDLGRLSAMHSSVPGRTEFIVDINRLWTEADFLAAAPTLRELSVIAVEQPTHEPTLKALRAGAENDLMIIWDETIRAAADIVANEFAGPQGTINVGISKMGGPSAARTAVTVAEAMGLPVAIGSLVETGIGSIAGAHVAATVAHLPLPSYVMGFLKYQSQLTIPTLEVEDGWLALPIGPGLGVEINEDAVAEITQTKETIR